MAIPGQLSLAFNSPALPHRSDRRLGRGAGPLVRHGRDRGRVSGAARRQAGGRVGQLGAPGEAGSAITLQEGYSVSDETKDTGTNVIDLASRRPTLPIPDVEVARDFLRDMLLEIHAAADEPQEVRQ